jgi:hypothetical protein
MKRERIWDTGQDSRPAKDVVPLPKTVVGQDLQATSIT